MEPHGQEGSLSEEAWQMYLSYFPPPPPMPPRPPQNQEAPVPLLALVADGQQEFDLEKQMKLHEQLLQQPENSKQQEKKRSRKKTKLEDELVSIYYTVPENNVSTLDNWAWRKYFQKTMNGSLYPRCEAHIGCTAKKVVEKNASSPNTFTVTYYGGHTHYNGRRTITFFSPKGSMGFGPSFTNGSFLAKGNGTSY